MPQPFLSLPYIRAVPQSYRELVARRVLGFNRRGKGAAFQHFTALRDEQQRFAFAVRKLLGKDALKRLYPTLRRECPPAGVRIETSRRPCKMVTTGCIYCWARLAGLYYDKFAAACFGGWLPATIEQCDGITSPLTIRTISAITVEHKGRGEWRYPAPEQHLAALRKQIPRIGKQIPGTPKQRRLVGYATVGTVTATVAESRVLMIANEENASEATGSWLQVTPSILCERIVELFRCPYLVLPTDDVEVAELATRFIDRLNHKGQGRRKLTSLGGVVHDAELSAPNDLDAIF